MDVEVWPVGRLKPYPGNPRHNDAGVDAVAASIKAWGFRQPIVADEQDVILVGHTRYKAALKLGLTEVPVHVARGLTPEQARAYRIADNQTATLSAWDDDLLVAELAALQAADFDLGLTGCGVPHGKWTAFSGGSGCAPARTRRGRRTPVTSAAGRGCRRPRRTRRCSPAPRRGWCTARCGPAPA